MVNSRAKAEAKKIEDKKKEENKKVEEGKNTEENKKTEEVKKIEEEKVEPKLTSMFYWPTQHEMQTLTAAQIRKKQTDHMKKYAMQNQKAGGGMNWGDLAMDSHVTELGDACIAAPFTFKFSSVSWVNTVICQGRTTITTTYQMYKILALNSMISAYSMSTLYLDGVKNGDFQMTMMGLAMGILFMLISLSKPLDKLSTLRPHRSIFSPSIVQSVLCQFVFHFITLIYIVSATDPYVVRDESTQPDTDFQPNLKNNVVFIYTWTMTATTFLVNYEGEPYMQPLKENSKLYKGLIGMYIIALFAIADVSDFVRESLQLVPFPDQSIQIRITLALALDTILCIIWWEVIKRISRSYKMMD